MADRRGGGYGGPRNDNNKRPYGGGDRGGRGGDRGGDFKRGPRLDTVVYANNTPIVSSNFFPLELGVTTYKYSVQFTPEVKSNRFKRSLLGKSGHLEAFIYDGTSLILQKDIGSVTFQVTSKDGTEYTIEISQCEVKKKDGKPQEMTPQEIRWLQNIIFKKMLGTLKLSPIGRHYFDETRKAPLRDGYELVPGFIASITDLQGKLYLNTDITHKLLHTQSVLHIINSFRSPEQAKSALIGRVVLTRYNNKTYRINDIDFSKNPGHTFGRRGTEITFAEYFRTTYKVELTSNEQPLIISSIKRKGFEDMPVALPPELCYLTGLDDEMRSDFNLMKRYAEITSKDPNARMNTLCDFVSNFQRLKENSNNRLTPKLLQELESWKLRVSPYPLDITARFIEERTVHFGNGQTYMMERPGDWTSFFKKGHIFHECKSLRDWLIIYDPSNERTIREFVHSLQDVSRGLGVECNEPYYGKVQNDKADSYISVARDNLERYPRICMVVCVLNSKTAARYEQIKRALVLEYPVPSQCIVLGTLKTNKGLKSVCTKVVQQMNSKLGGRLWAIGEDLPVPAMIVGIDVTHKRTLSASVAGFCASMDQYCGKWYSRALFQRANDTQVIQDGLCECMKDALIHFKEQNGMLPQAIIIYRDGVGDSQIASVNQNEVEALKVAVKDIYNNQGLPRFQVVLVQKKNNARFFYKDHNTYANPLPGTVVSEKVVSSEFSEFYLISQNVNKGSVAPTRYIQICSLDGIEGIFLQDLTYKLCHLYYNWSATIRVPAPIQYANKLCNLIGTAIKNDPGSSLARNLYYL